MFQRSLIEWKITLIFDADKLARKEEHSFNSVSAKFMAYTKLNTEANF
jgi:hypothetical protein